jgi:hypothetical protein
MLQGLEDAHEQAFKDGCKGLWVSGVEGFQLEIGIE